MNIDATKIAQIIKDSSHTSIAVIALKIRDYTYSVVEAHHGACECSYGPTMEGPEEYCPIHGRGYSEILETFAKDYKQATESAAQALKQALVAQGTYVALYNALQAVSEAPDMRITDPEGNEKYYVDVKTLKSMLEESDDQA